MLKHSQTRKKFSNKNKNKKQNCVKAKTTKTNKCSSENVMIVECKRKFAETSKHIIDEQDVTCNI